MIIKLKACYHKIKKKKEIEKEGGRQRGKCRNILGVVAMPYMNCILLASVNVFKM